MTTARTELLQTQVEHLEAELAVARASAADALDLARSTMEQAQTLREAVTDLVAWADEENGTGENTITSLLLRLERARAALAATGGQS